MRDHGKEQRRSGDIRNEFEAVEALFDAGVTVDRLCALAGSSEKDMTAELVGRRALSDLTIDALRGLLSPHQAEEFAALVGSMRAAYLEEVQAGRM
jgi:hypothetical protein